MIKYECTIALRNATYRSTRYGCRRQLAVVAVRLVSFNMNRLCKTFVCDCLQIAYTYVPTSRSEPRPSLRRSSFYDLFNIVLFKFKVYEWYYS